MARFIITRDFTLPNGTQGRQVWMRNGTWGKGIENARVFHGYVTARVFKRNADQATKRNLKLRIPGLKIMKCDIRQLLPEDLPGR